ncbi:unnamed protein product [Pseudo-nitzschia multistriata]|uniref:Uncharacterized protein n=1 Tax=Pseudo-nitzschia multistriata TaxID=183589 RepID=A0A448YXK5_9STRA|nr:unnamed protein product [Pseudo-nitzschia multistriata]
MQTQISKETDNLIDTQDGWYGRNDPRPLTRGKRIFIRTILIVLSPIVLALFLLYVAFTAALLCVVTVNDYQIKSSKVLSYENWWRAPGKMLRVKETGDSSSDIVISADMVNDDGELDTGKNTSLRKSIECTLGEHLRKGPHGPGIAADEDRDRPHYLLHGWPEPFDPAGDELWCTHARTATWAAIYSWSVRLRPGGFLKNWNQAIDLETAPEVFGYVYLFEIGNPDFYDKDRIARVGALAANAPDHTPETENKVFARYNYGHVKYMGDFPEGDPDAYVFKGEKVMSEARLRLLHTYRVINPNYA